VHVQRGPVKSVERRIPTRASFHPTYGGKSHPAAGRWLASHIVGQYGWRNDGNLTIENEVFIVHVRRGPVERRILTRASFHPTYGGKSHPAAGRWFTSLVVGQYGRRNDRNLTIENGVFTMVAQVFGKTMERRGVARAPWNVAGLHELRGTSRGCTSSVERRILTRASFHPTYGERCHPTYGVDGLRVTS